MIHEINQSWIEKLITKTLIQTLKLCVVDHYNSAKASLLALYFKTAFAANATSAELAIPLLHIEGH